jgi:hypothetical protein
MRRLHKRKSVANTSQPTGASLEWLKDVTPTDAAKAKASLRDRLSLHGSGMHTGNQENNGAMAEMQMAGPASNQRSARSAAIPLAQVPGTGTSGRAAEGSARASTGEGTA